MRPRPRPLVVRPLPDLSLDLVLSLHERAVRDARSLFLAEGARFLAGAVAQGASLAGIVICPRRLNGSLLRETVTRVERAGLPLLRASPSEYAALSPGSSSAGENAAAGQGVLLVLRQAWEPLPVTVARTSCGSASSRLARRAISAPCSARETRRAQRG